MRRYSVVGLGLLLGFSATWAGGDAVTTPTTQPAERRPAWSKAVNGLCWRVWLESDRLEIGDPIMVNIEFKNTTDKPLRLFKEATVSNSLYPMLYTSDGGKNVFSILHYRKKHVKPDETVLLGPGRTYRTKWSRLSTTGRPVGKAKIRMSYNSPKNTNPNVKEFWSGHFGWSEWCEFTIIPTRPETVVRRIAAAREGLASLWKLLEAHRKQHGKYPDNVRNLLKGENRRLIGCPLTGRTYGYNRNANADKPLIYSGKWTQGRNVNRIELYPSGRISIQHIETLPEKAKPKPAPQRLDAAAMIRMWAKMGSKDQEEAYKAVRALVAGGDKAVAFLKVHLTPITATEAQIRRLIKALSSDRYKERTAAHNRLSSLGAAAEGALRKAMEKPDTDEEARSRIRTLLADFESPFPVSPEAWRVTRGIRALEWIGSSIARQALADLVKGSKQARQTKLAQAALKRIAAQPTGAVVKKFGANRGTPIYSGYLFWDGQYIDAPYVVERWGLNVYVNGILLSRESDPEHVLGAAARDRTKEYYERKFKAGSAQFYKSTGGMMGVSGERAIALMESLLAHSSPPDAGEGVKDDDERRKEMIKAGKRSEFTGNFRPTRQLFLRLGMKPKRNTTQPATQPAGER